MQHKCYSYAILDKCKNETKQIKQPQKRHPICECRNESYDVTTM